MTVYGIFKSFLNRNEKSGYSLFEIKTENGPVICLGKTVQHYLSKTPLEITGEYNDRNELCINSVKACGYDYDAMVDFLCEANFKDIGPERAKLILDTFGVDLFEYVRTHEIEGTSEYERRLFSRLYEIVSFDELLDYLGRYDGNYMDAKRLSCSINSKTAIERLNENPFSCYEDGLRLELCEKIGRERGISCYDRLKTFSYTKDAIESSRNNGNTRITFNQVVELVRQKEKRFESDPIRPLFIAQELLSPEYVLIEDGNEVYVYKKEDFNNEKNIAYNIRRLNRTKKTFDDFDINKIKKSPVNYSPEQFKAFNILASSGIKMIYGGPGTGKTTILNDILRNFELLHPHSKISLCAPTGRAARRMQEITGRDALTIHKLLKIRPGEAYMRQEMLTADCVVVDEGSMADTWMISVLFSAIKDGATVILVGDKNQLASVGPGNVFEDFLSCNDIEKYQLKTIFRQNGVNGIIENSNKVINGQYPLIETPSFSINNYKDEDSLCAAAIKKACELKIADEEFKIITPVKKSKFLASTYNINKQLQQKLINNSNKNIIYGYNRFYIGDEVIFTRNNYEEEGNEYYNGQEGIITDIQNHSGNIYVTVFDGYTSIRVKNENLDDLELGYAITAHKSQGGECENIIILIPERPYGLLKRQLLYVEITRAKKNVWIYAEKDAIKTAISDVHEYKRQTGLKELIQ